MMMLSSRLINGFRISWYSYIYSWREFVQIEIDDDRKILSLINQLFLVLLDVN